MEDDSLRWYKRVIAFWRPHRTIPRTSWTASHPWDIGFTRIAILITGLAIFGIGDAFIIASELGNAPWSVLGQGLSIRLNVSIGIATILIGIFVLALWIPLRRRVGLGTLLNIIVISLFIDLTLRVVPTSPSLSWSIPYLLGGVALVGLGSALYLTCGLGPGPRDGLMTGLHEKSGVRVGRIRLAIELMVLFLGSLLGGTVGIGTAIFALAIGQSVAIWLGVVSRTTSK